MFSSDELLPRLTEDDIKKLFFVRKDLFDLSDRDRKVLLAKINSLGLVAIRLDTLHLILCVMHDARRVNELRFINEVFLPWCGLKQRTADHRRRIGDELGRVATFPQGSVDEAMHVANVYRNIVADLFDPYLTLVFASFQFVEGKFTTIQAADLGAGERTKYDYLLKRVNKIYGGQRTLLSGYDPRVRNAVSHPGSSGVLYRNGKVVFKNISRGASVTAETVEWTIDELLQRTLELIECIQSLDICEEIFGLDCTDVIQNNYESSRRAALYALTSEQRAGIRLDQDDRLQQIRTATDMTWAERLRELSDILVANYDRREMRITSVRVSSDRKVLALEVPTDPFDPLKDDELLNAAAPLIRYAILARSVFGEMFGSFDVVTGSVISSPPSLVVRTSGDELDAYINERAGLVDLLNDSSWFVNGQRIEFQVDFTTVAADEAASPDEPFPRKHRG
jgi:hypothetical protein